MAKKINALEHNRVPDHQILDEEDVQEVLMEEGIEVSELPAIKISDPAIEDLDVEVGDVIKILRDSHTAGSHKYYRRVIKD